MKNCLFCLTVKTCGDRKSKKINNIGVAVVDSDNIENPIFMRECFIRNDKDSDIDITESNVTKLKDEKMLIDWFLEIYRRYSNLDSPYGKYFELVIGGERQPFYDLINKLPEDDYLTLSLLAEKSISIHGVSMLLDKLCLSHNNVINYLGNSGYKEIVTKYKRKSTLYDCLAAAVAIHHDIGIQKESTRTIGSILKF